MQQPWAWALVSGEKAIENRSWRTEYRGPIIVQAGATKAVMNRFAQAGDPTPPSGALVFGALIGVVDLVDVVSLSMELEADPWAWGPYCWRVANPRIFLKPIEAKGKLKLYALDAGISEEVRTAVDSARHMKAEPAKSAWIERITRFDSPNERYYGLFYNYVALEDGPNLMRLAATAIEERGDSDAFADRAIARSFNGDYESALSDANRAIALDSLNQRAFHVRSVVYNALHKPKLATQDRQRADELGESQPQKAQRE